MTKQIKIASVAIVSAFSLLFWILQLLGHADEPGELVALYRHYDFNYFYSIARLFRQGLGEMMLLDSPTAQGVMVKPLTHVVPYAFFVGIFGGWGFALGDLFAGLLRLFAAWYLVSAFIKDKTAAHVSALAFFFATGEYTITALGLRGFASGVWSIGIARPMIASSYFVLSVATLVRLPEILSSKPGLKRLFVPALPVTLLFNSDPYIFLSVMFLYVGCLVLWLVERRLELKTVLSYGAAIISLCLPFLIYAKIGDGAAQRFGIYPVTMQLLTIEIPSRLQLVFFILAVIGSALFYVTKREGIHSRLLMIASLLLGASFFSSIFFAVVNGFNVQEYQYGARFQQLAGFLIVCWLLVLANSFPRRSVVLAALIAIGAGSVSFVKHYDYSEEYARTSTEPEIGFGARYHPGWRESARHVLEAVKSKSNGQPIVVATLDGQMRILLSMRSNVYMFLPEPQQTLASDQELEERFAYMLLLLGVDAKTAMSLFANRDLNIAFVAGGKYQFNRIHVYGPLSEYERPYLDGLPNLRDNWALAVPKNEAERFGSYYAARLSEGPSSELFKKYKSPDVVLLPTELSATPRGYTQTWSDSNMKMFELGAR